MFASLLLIIKKIVIALIIAVDGHMAIWCDVCGELQGTHEYACCACYEPCECDETTGAHLNIVHANE